MRQASIALVSLRSSLVNLPWSVVGRLVEQGRPPQTVVVALQWTAKNGSVRKLYAGWTGSPSEATATTTTTTARLGNTSDTPQVIELDRGFAPDDLVEARRCTFEILRWSAVEMATRVHVEPLTTDDWEVIESHATYVEENLLSQVRVAAKDMVFAVWVLGRTMVRVKVVSIGDEGGGGGGGGKKVVKFGNDTEIVITPKSRTKSGFKGTEKTATEKAVLANGRGPRKTAILARVFGDARSSMAAVDSVTYDTLQERLTTFPKARLVPFELLERSKGQPAAIVIELDPALELGTVVVSSTHLARLALSPGGLVTIADDRQDDVKATTEAKDADGDDTKPVPRSVAGMDTVMSQLVNKASSILSGLDPAPVQAILLSGATGSGKTTLLQHLFETRLRPRAWMTMVNCAKIADDRLPSLKESMSNWFDMAYAHAPAIVILDNLDKLLPAEMEHVDSLRARQLAELLLFFASRNGMEDRRVVVVASAKDPLAVHHILSESHFITENVTIKPPDRSQRMEILRASIQTCTGQTAVGDLTQVALETEGYLPGDIATLVKRAWLQNLVRSGNETSSVLDVQDFAEAQRDFVPLSLRDVTLEKSTTSWADIGGLDETKRVLRETLEWPTKYAAIFKNCPLRLRSGLLLYGFPGCGKTLLASAIAKECGLNFISVKGPELLNKYIGASEKSVRDLFDRATSAKPCVLFFDEFDSIAPKRGHDSTGVTDRVVNQMLTLMDGAEGLDGVYVLAATSRPDLIDPALLRPGRLDKSLLCNMPDVHERAKILQALTGQGKLHVAPDVDLEAISSACPDFTGADLQALLYNAHLAAVHESLKRPGTKKEIDESNRTIDIFTYSMDDDDDQVEASTEASRAALSQRLHARPQEPLTESVPHPQIVIEQRHLALALADSKASLPRTERLRLQRIYREFISGRSGKLPSGEASDEIGGRSSLM